ncbi:cobalt ECF transporter T component CbiQ [Micromonospora sp. WMMD710]|uniref:cobalt ECF transporter T component CbiQ n=1 Tax=Micromonospora sp. WMMD710 TaxID=3016085 RepID=UPI002416CC3D|nr:cobalt ECF transporter T component CbiQ [Micromonospora sp. WMMD710]MDG4760499.1 cobalt ECF transporter T component CbiQ [Micromonospora sp. WMMD710]
MKATVDPATASQTPAWLLQGEVGLCPCGCVGVRRKGSFVEKTLTSGAGLLRQVMFSEDVAAQRGLLQRLDPRVKTLGLLILLVAVGLVHHIAMLVAAYAATLVLAAASKLPVGFFVKRVWLFVPIFTGIIVLPATLSIVTPGHVLLPLWHWHGTAQGFTTQGLTSAGLVITRVATSVSLVVLLTLTTPWTRLLAGLRALGVPRIFILIIGMAYRYIFLLLATVIDMYEARKARTITVASHDGQARRFLGATAGALFGKAHHLSEEVHQAMVARGYRGEARTLSGFRLRAADGIAAALVLAAAVTIYAGDVFLGR